MPCQVPGGSVRGYEADKLALLREVPLRLLLRDGNDDAERLEAATEMRREQLLLPRGELVSAHSPHWVLLCGGHFDHAERRARVPAWQVLLWRRAEDLPAWSLRFGGPPDVLFVHGRVREGLLLPFWVDLQPAEGVRERRQVLPRGLRVAQVRGQRVLLDPRVGACGAAVRPQRVPQPPGVQGWDPLRQARVGNRLLEDV